MKKRWTVVLTGHTTALVVQLVYKYGTSVRAAGIVALLLVMGTNAVPGPDPGPVAQSGWNLQFEEVSEQAGTVFQTAGEVHDPTTIDKSWPAFPEIIGAGACWADFTGDGTDDLYIANQRYNDKNPYAQGYNDLFDPANKYYVNNGDGTFTDQTEQAGLESRTFDYGCTGVDADNDGHVDLLVTGFGHIKLYKNHGNGTFTDTTQAAGLDIGTACLPYECWTSCSAWVDYDGDGWLDVFVCTFVESDMEDLVRGPVDHIAQLNFLFRSNGDGTFTEVAKEAGVEGIAANEVGSKSWSAVWFDADLDGWPDLYVANDSTPNEFYWNNRNGTFTRDDEAGLYDALAGMGVTSGDTGNNGLADLYFTHYTLQHNGYYENNGDGTFTDRSGDDGLSGDWDYVGWGTHFVDLDRDGHKDILAVNGHTEWSLDNYDQDTLVFQNVPDGDGVPSWVDRSDESGPAVLEKHASRGAAFADYDLDGDVDVFVGNNGNQSAQLLQGSGVTNNWLYVQPVQSGPNHEAVGARVVVEANGVTQYREIQAGSSFLSQNSLLADFGVQQATQVDRVTIQWPHGNTTVVEDLPVNRVVRIDRETGGFVTDTLSPVTGHTLEGEAGNDDWFRSSVHLTLQAEDRAVGPPSGVATSEYHVGDDAWKDYPSSGVIFDEEGRHTLQYRSHDAVGNPEPPRSTGFGIDMTPPQTDHRIEGTPGSNGWWYEAELVLEASDRLSGVAEILYRINAGPWTPYDGPVTLQNGEHHIEYTARDEAGNEASPASVVAWVDGEAPEAAVSRPLPGTLYLGGAPVLQSGVGPAIVITADEAAGIAGTVFPVQVNAADPVSGMHRLDLFLNGQPAATLFQTGPEYVWEWDTRSHPAGTYLLEAVANDQAGNTAVAHVQVVLVPATPDGVKSSVTEGPSLYPLLPSG